MQKGQGKTLEGRVALKDAAIRHVAEDMPSPEQMTQVDAARHAHLEASSADLQTIALLNEDLRRANAELEASRAKLQASEDRLRTILESATEYAIITTDPQGQISGWSVGAQNIFGWTDEEVIGRDLTILFTPEDRSCPEAWCLRGPLCSSAG
ncbi:PAS domain S-box protein [Azospirillum canadense]|uniref:PAS domain S-box protein n=1 Tax=Azospirillum canadense TaxID=403962 RepID=UPI00222703EF|nr:PAS domain S-box protein [Azospirillum canadense]MCW2241471.1 PAS domain-containing protein [Azospirillum canadense]